MTSATALSRPTIVEFEGSRARAMFATLRLYNSVSRQRGLQRFAWALGRITNTEASAIVDLGGVRFRVYLTDGYWVQLLFTGSYEPEIEAALEHVTLPRTPFIDCGANIGYWSLLASVRYQARVIAIEPARTTFRRLTENVQLNGSVIQTINAAIWSSSGSVLTLVTHPERHAGASVVNRRDRVGVTGYGTEEVATVTLDEICRDFFQPEESVIIKLDVEDAETDALRGAREVLGSRDALLIYEDHGSDERCRVSREILKISKYAIFRWAPGFVPISNLDELRRVKTDRTRGYNFFAMREDSRFLELSRDTPGRPRRR